MKILLFLALLFVILVPANAQQADLLAAAAPMSLWNPPGGAVLTTLPADGSPGGFGQMLRIVVTKPAEAENMVSLTQILPAAIPSRRTLRLHFWGRSANRSPVRATYERNGPPWDSALNETVALTPQWKEYAFPLSTSAYPAGGAQVHFLVGQQIGTVDLAGIRLEDFETAALGSVPRLGWDPYGGQVHDDLWRPAAQARIKKFRMGNLVVKVIDAAGKPVPNAQVHVEQIRHKFGFGTAISDTWLFDQSPDGDKYRQAVLKDYNYVLSENALKWDFAYGPASPAYSPPNFAPGGKMQDWYDAHGLRSFAEPLLWPGTRWCPVWTRALHGQPLRDAIHSHITDYVTRTKGRVDHWYALNEGLTNTDIAADVGREIYAQAFFWAKEADPALKLGYNDNQIFSITSGTVGQYDAQVDALLQYLITDQKAPVSYLGIQAHMGENGGGLVPPQALIANLDHWATYKMPIEITEFDMGISDDAVEGQYMEEFMTAIFSHPSVSAFVQWGFWEKDSWRAAEGGAIIKADWTPRPAQKVFEQLVLHDWWTDVTGKADTTGRYQTRAFLGTQQVTVTANGKSQTVTVPVNANDTAKTVVSVRL